MGEKISFMEEWRVKEEEKDLAILKADLNDATDIICGVFDAAIERVLRQNKKEELRVIK